MGLGRPPGWRPAAVTDLHWTVSGHEGPCLATIHELGGSSGSFAELAGTLGEDMRILRYDQPGAGRSPARSSPSDLDSLVDDLARLVTESGLETPVTLVSSAAGAMVALGFADRWPDSVAGLVLCAPALSVDPSRRAYLEDRALMAEREGLPAVVEQALARSYPLRYRGDGQRYEAYRAAFLAADAGAYAAANRLLAGCDLSGALGRLRRPCLLIGGSDDVLRPPAVVRDLADRIPGARFEVIDSGHLVPVQAPAALAALVRDFVALVAGDRHDVQ